MGFRVGQKVVCIEETVIPPENLISQYPLTPVEGKVYTICEIMIGVISKKPCLMFHEIPAETVVYLYKGKACEGVPAWEASGFRPVVDRKTSIEVFQAMLTRPRLGVRA